MPGALKVKNSSAAAEDIPTAALSWQQDTFLDIRGIPNLLARYRNRFPRSRVEMGLENIAVMIPFLRSEWLMHRGIDSISFTPYSAISMAQAGREVERKFPAA